MTYVPDYYSDDEDHFSDDPDYFDFKNRIVQNIPQISTKDQQLRDAYNAVCAGDLQLLCEQLDNGLAVNEDVQSGWNAILLATTYGHYEVTEELLRRGADVNSRKDGNTVLMLTCNVPDKTTRFENTSKVVELLVEHGADVKAINKKRMTALMFACSSGNLRAVQFLLPRSEKNAIDNQNWSALFWAVSDNNLSVVRYLLEQDCFSESEDVRGNTIIDIARHNDYTEIVNIFVDETDAAISSIIAEYSNDLGLPDGNRPKFFLDVVNILFGVKSQAMIPLFHENKIDLLRFLSISEKQLTEIGVLLPYQRNRIMGGIYRFHKHAYHPNSLHIVPQDQSYTNLDVAMQLMSCIKQSIAMEAALKYILNNGSEELFETVAVTENVKNLRTKLRFLKNLTAKIQRASKNWDSVLGQPDLITKDSVRYRLPWCKIYLVGMVAAGFGVTYFC